MDDERSMPKGLEIELFFYGFHLEEIGSTCTQTSPILQLGSRPRKYASMRRHVRATATLAAVVISATAGAEARAAGAIGAQAAVASEHRLASQAGIEILQAGGNAVDAAVAALLVIGVVNPSSSGLGGGGFMVLFRASDRSFHTIDFREAAPGAARSDMFITNGEVDERTSKQGGLAVAIPAEPAGLAYALERYGTMRFADTAAPAIGLARRGFVVETHLASALDRHRDALTADTDLATDLLQENGRAYRAGDVLRRPRLAETLETLAREGPGAFYEGPIARDIVEKVRAAGGVVTDADLASYRVVERAPVISTYRGRRVVGMAPPSSGGGTIATALAILEPYRLWDLGIESPTYVHLLAETLKAVFALRARYYGDPAFTDVPLDRLISARNAASIRSGFKASAVVPASEYGSTPGAQDAGTSHVSVLDGFGNAVATTSSINTAFGAMIGVRGFVLNNTMDDFSAQPGKPNAYGLVGNDANAVAPGKRPLSSMSPTLVVKRGRVEMATGGSGGPFIISATLQSLLNVIDFQQDANAAVAERRVHHQWLPDYLLMEPGFPGGSVRTLERLGHAVKPFPGIAAVSAVTLESGGPNHGRIIAGSDDRKGGVAAAY